MACENKTGVSGSWTGEQKTSRRIDNNTMFCTLFSNYTKKKIHPYTKYIQEENNIQAAGIKKSPQLPK